MKPLALVLILTSATPAEPEWRPAPGPLSAAATSDIIIARTRDTPAKTSVEVQLPDSLGSDEWHAAGAITIDWERIQPTGFSRYEAKGMARMVVRTDDTTHTRTVLVNRRDRAVFIHLLANKPGALSFRVTAGGARLENRRELVSEKPTPSRVIVWPFESDVTPAEASLAVRGEGEALIVWNFGPATLWDDLARRYDPGSDPPNPVKIWQGLFDEHVAKPAAAAPQP